MSRFDQQQPGPARMGRASLVRLVVYALILGYLAFDLLLFHGPLWQHFYAETVVEPALGEGEDEVLAICFGETIRRRDLRAEIERLGWRRGEDYAGVDPARRLQIRRDAIEQLVVRRHLEIEAQERDIRADPDAVEAELTRHMQAWGGPERAGQRLAEAGWDLTTLRAAIAEEQAGAACLEALIEADLAAVGPTEARAWYDEHADELVQSPRARFGQIFLATLRRDSAEVRRQLESLRAVGDRSGASFATAVAVSDDERSKRRGGDLGQLAFPAPPPSTALDPLPDPVREQLEQLQPGEDVLVRSDIGWHWIWLEDDWQETELIPYEEIEEEIIIHLRNRVRRRELQRIRTGLWGTSELWLSEAAWAELPKPLPTLPAGARGLDQPAQQPPGS